MEKRLLIIDDGQDVVDVIAEVLADLFDFVDSAKGVDEAFKLITDNVYSLIALDINLEGRNGAEVIKFLIETPSNPNKSTPFVIISGMVTPQFIERNHKRFAGILMKPFEHSDLRKIAEEQLEKIGPKISNTATLEEIPYLKCELPFPIQQLEQRVNKILGEIKKNAKLKLLFSQMNIDRSGDNYIMTHIGMLINISTAICVQMAWNTDKTLEKFVYAAYLHDMALASRPDLARISTFEVLEVKKDTLSEAEYKLVFEHPNIAARSIDGMPEIPPDVNLIIRQHHELPKETGFPTRCGFQKIAPLSAVFIVAHDLTDYILANPKWNIEEYTKKSRSKFKGAHFMKILISLSDIK